MGSKEQGRARTGGDVEEERVGSRGHVHPEEGEPQNHLQGVMGTIQSSTYWW